MTKDAVDLKEKLENVAGEEVTDDHRMKHVKLMKDLACPDACMMTY